MQLATITYNGAVRHKTHRGPSGTRYVFSQDTTTTGSLQDARFFEDKPNYDVRWTATGALAKRFADGYTDAREALKKLGYRKKQSLAQKAGVKGNKPEEELEEELEDFAEELKHDMERQ